MIEKLRFFMDVVILVYLELWAEDDYNEKTDTALQTLTQQGEVFLV